MWGHPYAPAASTPGKDPVPLLQEAWWTPGPVFMGGKSRLHRDSISDRPVPSSVALPTELPGPPSCYVPDITTRCYRNLKFLDTLSKKYSNIKFSENPSSGSRVVPCVRTDEQRDMTKLMAAFRKIAKRPNETRVEIWKPLIPSFSSSINLILPPFKKS